MNGSQTATTVQRVDQPIIAEDEVPKVAGPVPSEAITSNWPERLLAAAMFVSLLPLVLLVALLVRVTSRGPVIYRQWRLGYGGKRFRLFKFRTMKVDAEAGTGPVWAKAADDRVTPIGGILRKLGLDELPQLVNVIRGEMALVGPRPERPEIADLLASQIPLYYERLQVRPGITGLAQINLPADTDIASVHRKLRLDLEYINCRNSAMNSRIILATVPRMMGRRGRVLVRMLGLSRTPSADPLHKRSEQDWGDPDESASIEGAPQLAYRPANPR